MSFKITPLIQRRRNIPKEDSVVQTLYYKVYIPTPSAPGNRKPEADHKIHGYLHSGVKEVIIIGFTGTIKYVYPAGRHITLSFP